MANETARIERLQQTRTGREQLVAERSKWEQLARAMTRVLRRAE